MTPGLLGSAQSQVHVAVGVIIDSQNRVLVSRRHINSHQGGFWEFPGGKLELGETVAEALQRELLEELGLNVLSASPLKKIHFNYADKSVLLDVYLVTEYSGNVQGMEGQPIKWQPLDELHEPDFPAANAGIVKLLRLPRMLAITPQVSSLSALKSLLTDLLKDDGSVYNKLIHSKPIIQLRQKQLTAREYLEWFEVISELCLESAVPLMFNHELDYYPGIISTGYHASADRLHELKARPVSSDVLFSASCHNGEELRRAEELQADFVLLSPVKATPKYDQDKLLGWEGFQQLAGGVSLPVYALGGMQRGELLMSRDYGAFGIAGISTFFHSSK